MEAQKKQSGLEIAAFVLGIIGMLTTCIVIGIVPCIIGLIFSIIVLCSKKQKNGMAIAGLVCSIIGILIFCLFVFIANQPKEENNESVIAETASTPEPIVSPEPIATPEHAETPTPVSTQTPEPTKSPEEIEQEYKDSCNEYKYKDVLRNPEDYVGEKVKITVKISTAIEESWMNDCKYYFAYSNDEYDWWLGDEYVIFDRREEQKPKLLEDDVITVYGEIADPEHTTSLILSSSELFAIDMKYIDFISE